MKIKPVSTIFLIVSVAVSAIILFPPKLLIAKSSCSENTCGKDTECLSKFIEQCQALYNKKRGEATTLTTEIEYADNQIYLSELRIQNTIQKLTDKEASIQKLTGSIADLIIRIDKMGKSVEFQETALNERMRSRYKSIETSPIIILLGSDTLNKIVQKTEYLKIMELQDHKLITRMNDTKKAYGEQKILYEDTKTKEESLKQQIIVEKANLEDYQTQLEDQKAQKQKLLNDTQNDAAKYQKLLSQAAADLESITAVLNGKGVEDNGTPIKSGQGIATIISGSSCNSSGTHLHFAVKKEGAIQNPFKYLKDTDNYVNCSGSFCGSSNGDSFNPSGSWRWPISGQIELYQGYGNTWATKYTWVGNVYSFHDGIDIKSSNLAVSAVTDGTYYRGSYSGTGGCSLKYVRLDHKNGLQSFYLHVSY